jgi:hypothetical protein
VKILVHIERLVLDGLPLDRRSAPLVQAALEMELARLLRDTPTSGCLTSGGATPFLRADSVVIDGDTDPGEIGRGVAQALRGGLQE